MKKYKMMKRCLFAAVILCVTLKAGTLNVWAETGTGTVKGTNVNVRSDAGTTASKVSSLNNGDALVVTGTKKDAAGNLWYEVSFTKNGKAHKGYIINTYVNYKKSETTATATDIKPETTKTETTKTETTEQSTNTTQTSSATKWKAKVTATNVNVRKKAVSGSVVGTVSTGKNVTVRKSQTGSDGKLWHYISFKANGTTKKGWIRSDFVQKTETQSSNTSADAGQASVQDGVTDINVGDIVDDMSQDSEENDKEETDVSETEDKTDAAPDTSAIKKGTMTGDYVRIRKEPVSGSVICQLMKGAQLIINGEKEGSDKKIWYQVSFTYNGAEKTGYVRSDFVSVQEAEATESASDEKDDKDDDSAMMSDAEFETYMTQQGFPETYKVSLRTLHASHPQWEFKAVATGLKWDDVIAAESKVGTNLVTKNAVSSWKSTEKTAYDWKNNVWYTFDGGAWVAASKEIISYYMDPRNFLTETAIFQFESLEYEDYQNATGVKRLLKGSFMSGKLTEPNGKKRNYANVFVKIGKKVGVNPYHLAARCYQEQGAGTSGSISGTVPGYENIFNYYNIGAYAANGNSPVVQGLIYASTKTEGDTNYDRPWNTHYKSLLGGAKYVAQKYVKVGQNTLYFQKFNVVNTKNGLYRHQYMTNVQAAESEALKMSKAYTNEDAKLVFYIPVYENMPETVCVKPMTNTNPNNYLATLEIKNQQLTPVFNPETDTYDLTVPKKVKKVKISATSVAATSTVAGTGKVKLKRGENVVQITCTAENGAVRTYTIHIVRE